jgi:UDP-2,3-diacylglucosamine pyrophosphatase LpxH
MHKVACHAIVSDLHFGDGGVREDFVFDRQLCGLLDYLEKEAQQGDGSAELIINGDFIDFLKVPRLAPGHYAEAVDKLQAVQKAHAKTFRRMQEFTSRGNRLVVLAGNHDVEMIFEEVQREFIRLIAGDNTASKKGIVFPVEKSQGAAPPNWNRPLSYCRAGVHIEHGNQYDWTNSFDHSRIFASEERGLLDLPLGSHFVYDIFNDIVPKYSFVDKIRPQSAAIRLLWLMDPKLVVQKLRASLRLSDDLFRTLQKLARLKLLGPDTPGGKAVIEELDKTQRFLLELSDDVEGLRTIWRVGGLEGMRQRGGGKGVIDERLSGAYATHLRHYFLNVAQQGASLSTSDAYAEEAMRLSREEGLELVCFGHTHDRKDITASGRRYLNCGTWIGLQQLNSEMLQLKEGEGYWELLADLAKPELFIPAQELTFVWFEYPGDKLQARLMRWTADGHPETVKQQ